MSRGHELIKALMGDKCVCGAAKQPKMSHCRGCYYALPPPMRKALYNRVGEGYEEAFDASVEKLKELGRVPK